MQKGFAHAKHGHCLWTYQANTKRLSKAKPSTGYEGSDYTQAGSFVPTKAVLSSPGIARSAQRQGHLGAASRCGNPKIPPEISQHRATGSKIKKQ